MVALAPLHPLYHLGAAISVVALAMRGQLQLRIVLLASLFLYVADEYFNAATPEWPYIFWNLLFAAINVIVIVELILDRTTFGLKPEEKDLYKAFQTLTPGEFRRLLRLAERETSTASETLTTEGVRPDHLFYVLDGEVEILKGDRRIQVQPPTFIGEIAFLRGTGASATVQIEPGARLLRWSSPQLQQHLARHLPLKIAFNRLLSDDLALKVANG
ncbi:MAG TPA: cyclic nucleotide-binding domain-containing protein [Lichenihabitans sp.]|jgi:hypothetical protein|nr:cyclic nucleotide-binding domain-containing protein [Lichenihabitans sp.]